MTTARKYLDKIRSLVDDSPINIAEILAGAKGECCEVIWVNNFAEFSFDDGSWISFMIIDDLFEVNTYEVVEEIKFQKGWRE